MEERAEVTRQNLRLSSSNFRHFNGTPGILVESVYLLLAVALGKYVCALPFIRLEESENRAECGRNYD